MPSHPKADKRLADKRLLHIFVSIIRIQDFLPHVRLCPLGATHCPKVHGGHDDAKPHRLFMVYEVCDGVNGQHCSYHGLSYTKQLTEKQKVDAVAQVVQLDPVPYRSEALLDWCVNYLLERQHLQPDHLIAVKSHAPPPASVTSPVVARPPPHMARRGTSHNMHHQGWMTSLIPALPTGRNIRGPSRVRASSRASTSLSVSAPVTAVTNVYAYTKDGRRPKVIEVDANDQGTMTYVNLCHPDILQAFGLKPRARSLSDKIQVYDAYSGKWYHPATMSLWLHLNSHESLILKAPTITTTPGLEDYTKAALAKPVRASADTLRGFLALSRTPADSRPPFSPVPPLTVMLAEVPENAIAPGSTFSSTHLRGHAPAQPTFQSPPHPSGSRAPVTDREHGSKHQKLNDGSAGVTRGNVIDLGSDDDDTPSASSQHAPRGKHLLRPPDNRVFITESTKKVKKTTKQAQKTEVIVISDDEGPTITHAPREVIIISDDEEPSFNASVDMSSAGGASGAFGAGAASESSSHNGQPPCALRPLTACESFRPNGGKGKARVPVTEVEDDSGAESDTTLC